jgi:ABC-type glycerol-3-phosphate transport system substrate-binding protein
MSKTISRREFIRSAAVVAGGAFLAACAPAATPEVIKETVQVEKQVQVTSVVKEVATQIVEKQVTAAPLPTVKLSLWHGDWSVWNPYFDGIAQRALYAGVAPKYEIDAPPMPWNEFNDKVAVAGEAGVGPDILYLNYNTYKRLIDAKAIRAVPETVYAYADIEKDFTKVATEPLTYFDGKYYYLPHELGPQGTCYNKTMLEKEGFKDPPKNWDEFLTMAKACVKKENGQVVQSGLGMDGPYMFYHDLMASIGGDYPGYKDATPDKLNSELGWEAMELLADYERKHDILHPAFSIGIGGWWAGAYLYGKQAFCWWVSSANVTLQQQNPNMKGGAITTDIIMPKLGAKGFQTGTRPNWGNGVTTACPDDKVDAAWNLWKYMVSTDELHFYTNLTLMASPRNDVIAMGRAAFPAGESGDEAILETEAIQKSGFIYGQPVNETMWRQGFQDVYDDVIGGKTAKQAFSDRWAEFTEGWTGTKA